MRSEIVRLWTGATALTGSRNTGRIGRGLARGVHQLEQNRQVCSVEGADAVIYCSQPQVAVQHPFGGDVSYLLPVPQAPERRWPRLPGSVRPDHCPAALRAQEPNLRRAVGCHVDEMVLADHLVMQDWFKVAARVAGKVVEKMGFGVHPKQVAGVNLVLIVTPRTDALFGDEICDVAAPLEFEGSAPLD